MAAIFIILKFLLILLIILLSLLILILFIPFNYLFSGNINENIELTGEVKWLFGLVKISIYFEDFKLKFTLTICGIHFNISNLANKRLSPKDKISNSQIHRSLSDSINTASYYYNNFKKIFNIIKPTYFNISGYFGFDDTSLTGKLTAVLNTFVHNRHINLIPVFDKEIIDIKAKLIGNVKVYLIGYVLIKSFFKNKCSKLFKKEKIIKKKECIN